jgi:hypothetical protein
VAGVGDPVVGGDVAAGVGAAGEPKDGVHPSNLTYDVDE